MQNLIYSLALILCISTSACKSQKSSQSSSTASNNTSASGAQNNQTQNTTQNTNNSVQEIYRLSVSFYSIGAGTDGEAIGKFTKFLEEYKPKVAHEISRWGREGEVNFCFRLSELKPKEQEKFVAEVKKLLASCQLVHIEENRTCVKKR